MSAEVSSRISLRIIQELVILLLELCKGILSRFCHGIFKISPGIIQGVLLGIPPRFAYKTTPGFSQDIPSRTIPWIFRVISAWIYVGILPYFFFQGYLLEADRDFSSNS